MSTDRGLPEKAPWITYRPELKVLDCTVRDGGLINAHQFSDEFVRAVYDTCLAAGVDHPVIWGVLTGVSLEGLGRKNWGLLKT